MLRQITITKDSAIFAAQNKYFSGALHCITFVVVFMVGYINIYWMNYLFEILWILDNVTLDNVTFWKM